MTNRSGPPSPRNEPWSPEDAAPSASDAAFVQWLKDGGQFDYDMRQKAAFAAGWKARKAAQYAGMIKRKPRTIVRKTFFPTMELGDDC